MPRQMVLNQTNRQGTFISASYQVPANITTVRVLGDVGAADLNSDKTFKLTVESSSDNGTSWASRYSFSWLGPTTEQPSVEVGVEAFVGQRIRAVLDIPLTMRLGATVEVI